MSVERNFRKVLARRAKEPSNPSRTLVDKPDLDALLSQIAALTRLVRSSWLTMLLACAYAWLTLATMTDPVVQANSQSLELPVIGGTIAPSGFLLVAPAIILVLFVYIHVNIARLWTYYRMLPPMIDGLHARDRVAPWIMTNLMAVHQNEVTPFRTLAKLAAILMGWIVPPVTIAALGGRYIAPTYFELIYHSFLLAVAIILSLRSALFAFGRAPLK